MTPDVLIQDRFWQGFFFAKNFFDVVLGKPIDVVAMGALFKEIAEGNLTLTPNPDEQIAQMEKMAEKPLPDEIKKVFHQMMGGEARRKADANNQDLARQYLAVFPKTTPKS
jgi:hypothetical protein